MTTLNKMMQDYEAEQMAEIRKIAVAAMQALIRKEPYETQEEMTDLADKAWKMAGAFCLVEAKITGVLPAEDNDE